MKNRLLHEQDIPRHKPKGNIYPAKAKGRRTVFRIVIKALETLLVIAEIAKNVHEIFRE